MSKQNKINWLIVIILCLLISCVAWLVWLDLKPSNDSNGLECIYNCSGYNDALRGL